MRLIREEKAFIREAVLLMLPMILQNFVTFSMSMADTFMVGVLGETALARLLERLKDPAAEPQTTVLEAQVLPRGSTAAPRAL